MGCATSQNDKKQKKILSHVQEHMNIQNKAQSQNINFHELKLLPSSPQRRIFMNRSPLLEKNIMNSAIMLRRMDLARNGHLMNNSRNQTMSFDAKD